MIYKITRISNDVIKHEIVKKGTTVLAEQELGVSSIPNLKKYLQEWVDQRKKLYPIKKVTNNLGYDLKQEKLNGTI